MDKPFLSGVIEGFYGRPWTKEQRIKLFMRMKKLGLNTYLYAPKDDMKHRGFWRDPYTVEEMDILTELIEAADNEGIAFVYALSPGLDMAYSNLSDVSCLKRKLDQVQSLGCHSFALLFDDIKAELRDADKDNFPSLAHAQISVTNEIYQHLQDPVHFFFCPTEYCLSRAKPTLAESRYLSTIGAKLLSAIDIMWTGPKVVSRKISIKSIEEVSEILQRPVLIWDNIHANDYDYTRVFLGPYEGRSPELRPYIRGILTNPNREFEANFIALHTLSQWTKCNVNAIKKDIILTGSPVSAEELQLETDGDFVPDEDSPLHSCSELYIPRQALKTAISEWHDEFFVQCDAPQVTPPNDTASLLCAPPPADPTSLTTLIAGSNDAPDVTAATVCNDVSSATTQRPLTGLLGSVVLPPVVAHDLACEPMDCLVLPAANPDYGTASSDGPASNETMQVDGDVLTPVASQVVTLEDVTLLVDLFYLPFEYGRQAVDLLNDLDWIISNIGHRDWNERQALLVERMQSTTSMIERVCDIPNKSLLLELYPYVWAAKIVISLLVSFIQWIGLGKVPASCQCFVHGGPSTWSNQEYQSKLSNGDTEPWLMKGGIIRELQKMLPFECSSDLLLFPYPPPSESGMYCVRPYMSVDKSGVYDLFKRSVQSRNNNFNGWITNEELQLDLTVEIMVGSFLWHSSDFCFVVLDNRGVVCASVLATFDAASFFESVKSDWIPEVVKKFQGLSKKDALLSAQEIVSQFETYKNCLLDNQSTSYPSLLRIDSSTDCVSDKSALKRAVACAVAALKVTGSCGVYTQVPVVHGRMMEFYQNLGLFEIGMRDGPGAGESTMVLGRNIAVVHLIPSSPTPSGSSVTPQSSAKWCHMCYCCSLV